MDIDLFISPQGKCGLLCNADFKTLPAGVIFDAETKEMTIEFLDDPPFHLNIPVDLSLQDNVLLARKIYIAFFEDGIFNETVESPILYLNDPYGGDFNHKDGIDITTRTLVAFEQFMKRCNFAQPVHRDFLGNEDSNASVLKGINPKSLQFAPQLLRQHRQELAIKGLEAAPELSGPQAPGPKGPGMMGGTGSRNTRVTPVRRQPPAESDDDKK